MTFGQLAGLIAAIAFLILVVFACVVLNQVTKIIRGMKQSMTTLTRDVDNLSKEVEEVLSNTNSLLTDINKKSSQIDPAVKAVADVGQSVVDINDHVHKLTAKITSRRGKNRFGMNLLKAAGQTVVLKTFNKFKQRRAEKKGADADE